MRHARAHVTEAAAAGIDLKVVVAGSERRKSEVLVDPGGPIYYLDHPNRPLGAKFNAALHGARDLQPEYVCVCGSDCFFRPSLWEEAAQMMSNGVQYFGPEDLYMFDVETDRGVYWPGYGTGRIIGSGRFIHRSILDGVAWSPYNPDKQKTLDISADEVFPRPVAYSAKPHLFTSVKTVESLNPISAFKQRMQAMHTEYFHELLAQF